MNESIHYLIQRTKIIAISRKLYGKELEAWCGAMFRGGIELLEITFDQSDSDRLRKTGDAIATMTDTFPEKSFGAGTVLTIDQVKCAADAGAKFIISPNVDADVIRETKRLGLISIPGAMTPTEILSASRFGADYVKLFPAESLGIGYIKSIMAPINHIKLIATGGVNVKNAKSFLDLGMAGLGIGGNLCPKDLIDSDNFEKLEENARAMANAIR